MKAVKKLAAVLKFAGVVLLCLSIVFSVYSLANGGSHWSSLKTALTQSGVSTNLLQRVDADRIYFAALSDASKSRDLSSSARAAELVHYYDKYQTRAAAGEEAQKAQRVADTKAYFDEKFDFAAFIDRYQAASGENAHIIGEACARLDEITVNKLPNGKILPKKPGEDAASVLSAAYATLSEEKGEDAGTYTEYVETVLALAEAAVESGAAPKDLKAFVEGQAWDDYAAALKVLQESERATSSLKDAFIPLAEQKAAGETADYEAFFEETRQHLSEMYPGEAVETDVCAVAVKNLLSNPTYDGSYAGLLLEIKAVSEAQKAASFSAWVSGMTSSLLGTADQRSSIGVIGAFWKIISLTVLWWVLAIALLIASRVVTKVMTVVMIKQLKNAGIDEDPDVLLRVEHLSQYFRSGSYINKAVDDVSFYIKKGEVFGLVGESGCGKTTTGRTIINLYDPTDGDVYFQGLRVSSTKNGLPIYKRQKRNELKQTIEKKKAELNRAIAACQKDAAKAEQLKRAYNEEIAAMKDAMRTDFVKKGTHALESFVEKSKCIEMYRARRKAELTAEYEKDIQGLSGQALQERKDRFATEMKLAAKDNIMTRMQMIFQDPIASINPRMTVREIIAEGLIIRGVKDKKYIDDKVNEMLELVGLVREHADRYPHEFSGGQRQRIGIARAIVMQPDLIIADEPISALDVSIQAQVINLMNDLRKRMGLTIMFIAHNLSVVKYFSDRIGVMYFGRMVELATSEELFAHPLHPYTKSLLSAIPYPDPHREKKRQRIEYNPNKVHDYSADKPTLREIVPGHFILCNNAEFEKYQKELGV